MAVRRELLQRELRQLGLHRPAGPQGQQQAQAADHPQADAGGGEPPE